MYTHLSLSIYMYIYIIIMLCTILLSCYRPYYNIYDADYITYRPPGT